MTIQTEVNTVVGRGNGAAVVWPFAFRVDDAAHLVVQRRVFATGIVDKTYTSGEYVVAGIGDSAGGSVTITPALSSVYELVIQRKVPYTQELDIQNQGGFFADAVESQLDNIVMQVQQVASDLGRSVKLAVGETAIDLPAAEGRKGKFLGFSTDTGAPIAVAGSTSGDVAVIAAEAARDEAQFARDEAVAAAAVFATGQAIRAQTIDGYTIVHHVRPDSNTSEATASALEWAKGFDAHATLDSDTQVRVGRVITAVSAQCKIPATATKLRARVFSRAASENGVPEGGYDTLVVDTGPVTIARDADYTGFGRYALPLPTPFTVEAAKCYVLAWEFHNAAGARVAAGVPFKTIGAAAQRLRGYLDTGAGWANYAPATETLAMGFGVGADIDLTDALATAVEAYNPVASVAAPSLLRPIELLFLEREPWRNWRYPGVPTAVNATNGREGLANMLGKAAWSPGYMMGEQGVTFGHLTLAADLINLSTDPNYVDYGPYNSMLLQSTDYMNGDGGFVYRKFKLLEGLFEAQLNGATLLLEDGLIDANGVSLVYGIQQPLELSDPGLITMRHVTVRGPSAAGALLTHAHAINCEFDFNVGDNVNGGTAGLANRKLWFDGCLFRRPGSTTHPQANPAAHADCFALASPGNTKIIGSSLFITYNTSGYTEGVYGPTSGLGFGAITTDANHVWALGSIIGGGSYNVYIGLQHANADVNNWMLINNLFAAGGGLAPAGLSYSAFGEFFFYDYVAGASLKNLFIFGNVGADGHPVRFQGTRLPVAANVPAIAAGAQITVTRTNGSANPPDWCWTPAPGTTLCGMFGYDPDTLGDAELEAIDRLGRNHGIEIINPLTRALNPLYDFGDWVHG